MAETLVTSRKMFNMFRANNNDNTPRAGLYMNDEAEYVVIQTIQLRLHEEFGSDKIDELSPIPEFHNTKSRWHKGFGQRASTP